LHLIFANGYSLGSSETLDANELLSAVLTTSVALEGIFFAAFGIFYQVYATYCIAVKAENPIRASVVFRLRLFCRILAGVICLEAVAASVSAYYLSPCTFAGSLLVGLTIIPAVIMAVIAPWLAFWWME
jgi:hypothetical protein